MSQDTAASPVLKTRVVAPHSGGTIDGYHSVMFFAGQTVYRDTLGRKNRSAHHRWAVCVCNNPGCTAEVIVDVSVLDDAASCALPGQDNTDTGSS